MNNEFSIHNTGVISTGNHPCPKEINQVSSPLIQRIKDIVLATFNMISFPLRYLGAKTWSIPGVICRFPYLIFMKTLGKEFSGTFMEELLGSGYHYRTEKQLSREELKTYLKYACANASVHLNDPSFIEPLGWKELKENRFFDPQTGLKISLYKKNDEIIVSFGALRSNECEFSAEDPKNQELKQRGLGNAVMNLFGGIPKIYAQADGWITSLVSDPRFEKKKITLSGQCYGGSFASYLGLKHHINAVCINTLQLGAGLQQEIGHENLSRADSCVTHISIDNDYISDVPCSKLGDRIVSLIGLRTPGNFGHRYSIPSAFYSCQKTHYFALGSMMHHLGFHKRTRPSELPEDFRAIL